MSLDFNLSGIKNYEQVCYVRNERGGLEFAPATESIIWATMLVDMGTITRKNVHEFWGRYVAMSMDSAPYFSRADVYNHIGLTTNVHTVTRAAFLKKVSKNMDYIGEGMEAVAQKMDKHFDTQAGIAEMNDELANN
jgi:hypothetical protein